MSIARTVAIGTAAAGLLLASACSSSDSTTTSSTTAGGGSTSSTASSAGSSVPTTPGTTASATVTDPSKPIEATVGEEVTIVVDSNPTTGYEWTVTGEPDAVIAEPVGSTPASGGPRPGQGGTQTFTFKATGAGTTTITLTYARSFAPDDNPTVQEYTLVVSG